MGWGLGATGRRDHLSGGLYGQLIVYEGNYQTGKLKPCIDTQTPRRASLTTSVLSVSPWCINPCPYRILSRRKLSSSLTAMRSCAMVSRSRMVTVSLRAPSPWPSVSKSTVMQKGVPISSWRR
jgi:hypothetical protein